MRDNCGVNKAGERDAPELPAELGLEVQKSEP